MTAYLEGIKANMQKLNLADSSITHYTTLPAVAVGSANLTLALIMKEKYIGCFLNAGNLGRYASPGLCI